MLSQRYVNLSSSYGGQSILLCKFGKSINFNRKLSMSVLKSMSVFPQYFEGHEDQGKSVNHTCWSRLNLFDLNIPEFNKLKLLLARCINFYFLEFHNEFRGNCPNFVTCWANIVKDFKGDVPPHRHHESSFNIAGVYYVGGDYSGVYGGTKFWFRIGKKSIVKEFRPKVGTLILFPASLYHSMSLYNREIPRITLGFDIRFRKNEFFDCPSSILS